ncbi:3-oxoacyl-[acyl-carrier-protein] synthase III C-terminal domain-containing protein [Streptomyces sp. NPDC055962]|uniref:3-oxoacyl-[acyl-carrier-protein] synthase III C-terminal domain-containing protein n=1 Tax=Streptomyces sp. NPDC055962 TaxID=3345667 RepID=UPI0035E33A9A
MAGDDAAGAGHPAHDDPGTWGRRHLPHQVPRAAHRGLNALGRGTTFADLHRLCLHESNPRMLAEVATGLGAPDETVHNISATVGTLAGVSAFTLLEEAFHSHRNRRRRIRRRRPPHPAPPDSRGLFHERLTRAALERSRAQG